MKILTLNRLTALMIAVMLIISCDSQVTPAIKLTKENSLISVYKGHFHTGKVTIANTQNNEIIVGLSDGEDNDFDRIFIFQSEEAPFIEKVFKKAELLYMHNSLIINSLDEKFTIMLTVGNNDNVKYYETLKHQVGTIELELAGFGLNNFQSKNVKSINLDVVKSSKNIFSTINNEIRKATPDTQVPDDGGGDGGDTCLAGGCGSTECSYSVGTVTCSVTCADKYHACCQSPLVCKCRKNSTHCDNSQ